MTPEELKIHNAGKKVYRDTGELKTMEVNKMDIVDDAMLLVRDKNNKKEVAYANLANSLKNFANEARKEYRKIKPIPVDQTAKETYAEEVESLNAKLRIAKMNAPKERQAQMIANSLVSEKLKSNPDMDFEHRKRAESIALTQARAMVGAKKQMIEITDKEWQAIQANAISDAKLQSILNNTDQEKFKQRATPRKDQPTLTDAQIRLIESMNSSGLYTLSEMAERLGVSVSTISQTIKSS